MTTRFHGRIDWSGGRDDDGYTEYVVKHMVEAGVADGPAQILATAGLPRIGSFWNFGNDTDARVWCWPYARAEYIGRKDNEPHCWWSVEQKFSNKQETGGRLKTCLDDTFENPLLEPQKVSGSFVENQRDARYDKDGIRIQYSTGEPILGSDAIKTDYTRATVKIEQNVAVLGLSTVAAMMNRVNASALWGMAACYVKLSRFSWERKIWGTCAWYYTRSFEFDIDPDGFDKTVDNESQLALAGKWVDQGAGLFYEVKEAASGVLPAVSDPKNYSRYTDKSHELSRALIDGLTGLPAGATWNGADGSVGGTAGPATTVTIQKYKEANFLLLGIPTIF